LSHNVSWEKKDSNCEGEVYIYIIKILEIVWLILKNNRKNVITDEKKSKKRSDFSSRILFSRDFWKELYIDKQYSDKLHSQNNTFAMYDISQWDSL
jgi:hypothetical protein